MLVEVGRYAGRCPARIEQDPVDVGPCEPSPSRVHEIGPPSRPDATPADDLRGSHDLVADAHVALDGDLSGACEPGQPALSIPVAREAAIGRVVPGEVLRVSQQHGRADAPIGRRLIEPNAIRGRAPVGLARCTASSHIRSRRFVIDRRANPATRAPPAACHRRARSSGRAGRRTSAARRRRPGRPGDARPPPPRGDAHRRADAGRRRRCRARPICSRMPRLAPSRSTVTSYGWISARTPSNRMRRSRRMATPAARRASSRAVSSSTIAPRNWLRTASPRSATSRATSSSASARSRGAARRRRSEQRREHRRPRRAIGRLAVHHGTRQDAHRRRRRPRAGQRRVRPADRPGWRRRPPRARRERHPGTSRSPRQGRRAATWGNVESQSIARCGSSIRLISPIATSIAGVVSAGRPSSPRATRIASNRSPQASVRSWMYDHSSSISSPSSANVA